VVPVVPVAPAAPVVPDERAEVFLLAVCFQQSQVGGHRSPYIG
jgi:hypothetical protein